ncbi:MAG: hypothetical protein RL757_1096 [Bacteroidota bacterium]|jgi:hypothetical protein
MRNYIFRGLTLLAFIALFDACRPDDETLVPTSKATQLYDAQVATDWFTQFRTLTKKCPGFSPPVASRAFGYAGLTLYETVVGGMPKYQSITAQLSSGLTLPTPDPALEYDWAIAANAAMAIVAKNYYANMPADQLTAVSALESTTAQRLQTNVQVEVANRSKTLGEQIAKAIFEWSKTDGGHEGYTKNFPSTYVVPTGSPEFWVPTGTQRIPLQPFWGNNRTFIVKCAENTQPIAPATYSVDPNSVFYWQAREVYTIGKNLTTEQTTIAKYWSDDPGEPGTPPGHIVSIANQVVIKENARLDRAAETLAKVGIAISDGFVSCWKCKYQHNLLRPVSYIKRVIDSNYTTLLATPGFPEYTSGHSVQTAAAARVLSDLYGYSYSFSDETHKSRTDINGAPRSFLSFNSMANEAAISRLYGGIHYRDGVERGIAQGNRVGQEVSDLRFKR